MAALLAENLTIHLDPFAVGDAVELTCGGYQMTVTALYSGKVECTWHSATGLPQTHPYPPAALRLAKGDT